MTCAVREHRLLVQARNSFDTPARALPWDEAGDRQQAEFKLGKISKVLGTIQR
jgi:hypothetical protein